MSLSSSGSEAKREAKIEEKPISPAILEKVTEAIAQIEKYIKDKGYQLPESKPSLVTEVAETTLKKLAIADENEELSEADLANLVKGMFIPPTGEHPKVYALSLKEHGLPQEEAMQFIERIFAKRELIKTIPSSEAKPLTAAEKKEKKAAEIKAASLAAEEHIEKEVVKLTARYDRQLLRELPSISETTNAISKIANLSTNPAYQDADGDALYHLFNSLADPDNLERCTEEEITLFLKKQLQVNTLISPTPEVKDEKDEKEEKKAEEKPDPLTPWIRKIAAANAKQHIEKNIGSLRAKITSLSHEIENTGQDISRVNNELPAVAPETKIARDSYLAATKQLEVAKRKIADIKTILPDESKPALSSSSSSAVPMIKLTDFKKAKKLLEDAASSLKDAKENAIQSKSEVEKISKTPAELNEFLQSEMRRLRATSDIIHQRQLVYLQHLLDTYQKYHDLKQMALGSVLAKAQLAEAIKHIEKVKKSISRQSTGTPTNPGWSLEQIHMLKNDISKEYFERLEKEMEHINTRKTLSHTLHSSPPLVTTDESKYRTWMSHVGSRAGDPGIGSARNYSGEKIVLEDLQSNPGNTRVYYCYPPETVEDSKSHLRYFEAVSPREYEMGIVDVPEQFSERKLLEKFINEKFPNEDGKVRHNIVRQGSSVAEEVKTLPAHLSDTVLHNFLSTQVKLLRTWSSSNDSIIKDFRKFIKEKCMQKMEPVQASDSKGERSWKERQARTFQTWRARTDMPNEVLLQAAEKAIVALMHRNKFPLSVPYIHHEPFSQAFDLMRHKYGLQSKIIMAPGCLVATDDQKKLFLNMSVAVKGNSTPITSTSSVTAIQKLANTAEQELKKAEKALELKPSEPDEEEDTNYSSPPGPGL